MSVFVAGGTGYIGRPLIQALLKAGHTVRALVRPGSENNLPARCRQVIGNALDAARCRERIAPAETFVHLVGVAHRILTHGDQGRSLRSTTSISRASRAR